MSQQPNQDSVPHVDKDPFTGRPLGINPLHRDEKYKYEPLVDEREAYDGNPFYHHGKLATTRDLGRTVVDHGSERNMISGIMRAANEGAVSIELTPNVNGAAPGQGIESINTEHRKQIKDFVRLNDMNVTGVHVHPSHVGNVSGFSQNGFSDQVKNSEVAEIKKGIDFNADIDGGGVVFHTNEFPRSNWGELDNLGHDISFKPQNENDSVGSYYVVDKTNGRLQAFEKNHEFIDVKLKSKQDATQPFSPVIEKKNWVELKKNFDKDEFKRQIESDLGIGIKNPNFAQSLIYHENKGQIKSINAQLEKTETDLAQTNLQLNNVTKLYDSSKQFESTLSEVELNRNRKIRQGVEFLGPLVDSEYYDYIRKQVAAKKGEVEDQYATLHTRKHQFANQLSNFEDAESYGFESSVNGLVDLAHYAKRKTDEAGDSISKPIFLAPENIFPDNGFGAHPQEMKKLVLSARQKFAKQLIDSGEYSNYSEAYKKASDHIRSTFDTQHMGMWYGNMVEKENETSDEKLNRFKKWYLDQVDDVSKEDVYGGMHIVDGFVGHTHVDIGQGIHPVVDAVKIVSNNTKGFLALNNEAYEGENMLGNIWSAFNVPMTAPTNALEGDAFGKIAASSIVDNSFAGIGFAKAPTWADGVNKTFGAAPTMYNSPQSFPKEYGENSSGNWDGLPLE